MPQEQDVIVPDGIKNVIAVAEDGFAFHPSFTATCLSVGDYNISNCTFDLYATSESRAQCITMSAMEGVEAAKDILAMSPLFSRRPTITPTREHQSFRGNRSNSEQIFPSLQ